MSQHFLLTLDIILNLKIINLSWRTTLFKLSWVIFTWRALCCAHDILEHLLAIYAVSCILSIDVLLHSAQFFKLVLGTVTYNEVRFQNFIWGRLLVLVLLLVNYHRSHNFLLLQRLFLRSVYSLLSCFWLLDLLSGLISFLFAVISTWMRFS